MLRKVLAIVIDGAGHCVLAKHGRLAPQRLASLSQPHHLRLCGLGSVNQGISLAAVLAAVWFGLFHHVLAFSMAASRASAGSKLCIGLAVFALNPKQRLQFINAGALVGLLGWVGFRMYPACTNFGTVAFKFDDPQHLLLLVALSSPLRDSSAQSGIPASGPACKLGSVGQVICGLDK